MYNNWLDSSSTKPPTSGPYLEYRLAMSVEVHHFLRPVEERLITRYGHSLVLQAPDTVLVGILSAWRGAPDSLQRRVALVL